MNHFMDFRSQEESRRSSVDRRGAATLAQCGCLIESVSANSVQAVRSAASCSSRGYVGPGCRSAGAADSLAAMRSRGPARRGFAICSRAARTRGSEAPVPMLQAEGQSSYSHRILEGDPIFRTDPPTAGPIPLLPTLRGPSDTTCSIRHLHSQSPRLPREHSPSNSWERHCDVF